MSVPKFPEIDPEMTCDRALHMILASIAMEELALSHILNAEGEKIQYVLGTLETSCGMKYSIDEVLKVNQSVTSLLDSVSQNQMILKNKMDKALHALENVCGGHEPPCPPKPPGPPGPPRPPAPFDCQCKCSAAFRAAEKCRTWCSDSALHWDAAHLHGRCVRGDRDDKAKIDLCSKGRFIVHFSANVRSKSGCRCNAAIRLHTVRNQKCTDVYTVHGQVSAETTVTMSMSGVIIDTFGDHAPESLMFRLSSHGPLTICSAMLSIVEI